MTARPSTVGPIRLLSRLWAGSWVVCFYAQLTMMVITGRWLCTDKVWRQNGRQGAWWRLFCMLMSSWSCVRQAQTTETTEERGRGGTDFFSFFLFFYAQQLSCCCLFVVFVFCCFFKRPVNHDGYTRAMVVRRQRWRQNGRLGRVHDGAW